MPREVDDTACVPLHDVQHVIRTSGGHERPHEEYRTDIAQRLFRAWRVGQIAAHRFHAVGKCCSIGIADQGSHVGARLGQLLHHLCADSAGRAAHKDLVLLCHETLSVRAPRRLACVHVTLELDKA